MCQTDFAQDKLRARRGKLCEAMGANAVAAHRLRRCWIGVELERRIAAARERLRGEAVSGADMCP